MIQTRGKLVTETIQFRFNYDWHYHILPLEHFNAMKTLDFVNGKYMAFFGNSWLPNFNIEISYKISLYVHIRMYKNSDFAFFEIILYEQWYKIYTNSWKKLYLKTDPKANYAHFTKPVIRLQKMNWITRAYLYLPVVFHMDRCNLMAVYSWSLRLRWSFLYYLN